MNTVGLYILTGNTYPRPLYVSHETDDRQRYSQLSFLLHTWVLHFVQQACLSFIVQKRRKRKPIKKYKLKMKQPYLARPRCSAYQAVILSSHISGVIWYRFITYQKIEQNKKPTHKESFGIVCHFIIMHHFYKTARLFLKSYIQGEPVTCRGEHVNKHHAMWVATRKAASLLRPRCTPRLAVT